MKSPPKTQGVLRVRSPAKVTPWLHVLRQRADGYHEVRLCLVPVSLYDALEFRAAPQAGATLTVESAEPLGAERDNLVWRAWEAFARATGRAPPVAMRLIKAIPAGAGLGGGSGDAAATLLALNHIAGAPLSRQALAELALELGSDVPFFLDPRPALASGRGERLVPLAAFPTAPLLVVKPALALSTAEAYARVSPRERPETAPEAEPGPASLDALLARLENDFEAALFPEFQELGRIKARLLASGAAGALLSGSGSALFGIFRDAAARDRAARALAAERDWRVLPCEMLARHDYGLVDPLIATQA